nr:hypothetical protein [Odonatan tombus-related virus]
MSCNLLRSDSMANMVCVMNRLVETDVDTGKSTKCVQFVPSRLTLDDGPDEIITEVIRLEGPPQAAPTHRTFGTQCTPIEMALEFERRPRKRYQHRGEKQAHPSNVKATDKDDNPWFEPELVKSKRETSCFDWVFPCRKKKQLVSDVDLVAHLKLEALFTPRTPLLLAQLRLKAKRFLADFDLSPLTAHEAYVLTAQAVGMAYDVSEVEQRVIDHLKSKPVRERISAYNQFLARGGE